LYPEPPKNTPTKADKIERPAVMNVSALTVTDQEPKKKQQKNQKGKKKSQ
jgi:hypothetical protein